MARPDRALWHRIVNSISGAVARDVAGHSAPFEAEMLRQLSDVFKELASISNDLGAAWRSLEDVKTRLEVQAVGLRGLDEALEQDRRDAAEAAELAGRLLASTRARLDVLESSSR